MDSSRGVRGACERCCSSRAGQGGLRLGQRESRRGLLAPRLRAGRLDGLTYKDAGVDIDAGAELVRRIKKLCPDVGGFGAAYPIGNDQFLVSGTDGVGTKLKIAIDMDKHDTIGVDLVAMSVNDIITLGAKPLFFLDYFATSKLDVDQAEQVVKGIVDGCDQSGCALLGGETAEMPGFYQPGDYDLSGFAVGIVRGEAMIDGASVEEGDALVGLPSSGVHSNGFSLVRRVLAATGTSLSDALEGDPSGRTVGEALLAPTKIYARQVLAAHEAVGVRAAVHVTGGGFQENIPRCLPEGMGAEVARSSWRVPAVFEWLQREGRIAEEEMFRTFNMGVGFILVVERGREAEVVELLPEASVIGKVVKGRGVTFV